MSRFTPTARRAAVAAVVLAALVPAAHASVPPDSTRAEGVAIVSGAPGAPGAVPIAADAADRAPGRVRTSAAVATDGANGKVFYAIPTPLYVRGPVAPNGKVFYAIPTPEHVTAPGNGNGKVFYAIPTPDPVRTPPVAADAPDRVPAPAPPVGADAPDRVPVAQAPADDGGLSLPTVLLVALLAAAASVGLVTLIRRGLRGSGTASPSRR